MNYVKKTRLVTITAISIFTLMLLCAACMSSSAYAFAADSVAAVNDNSSSKSALELVDPDAKGSISVEINSSDGKTLKGTVAIYQAAELISDDTGFHFVWTDDFAGCTEDIYNMSGTLTDSQSKTIATKLDAIINQNSLKPLKVINVQSGGEAYFGNLPVGLYIIKQTKSQKGYDAIDPFVVTVPLLNADGTLTYDVDAQPKAGIATKEKTKDTPKKDKKLPQTGQLWWPVWILLAAGSICLTAGIIRKRGNAARY